MHRIDNASAATSLPTPKPAGPQGYFTEGNVQVGQSPTIVEADWLNNVQEEFMNVLQKGGITPDKTSNAQLLQALSALFTGAFHSVTATQDILVPPWATQIAFRMVGAGGGGSHCQSNGTSYTSGGGGGSGAYAEAQRLCSPGELLHAVIGVGGAYEAGGTTTSLARSGDWTVSAGGGAASLWDAPNNSHGGGGGGAAGGDLNSLGTAGGDGLANGVYATTGYGGPSFYGGGPRSGNTTVGPGGPGQGPGAGGGGVYDNTNSGNFVPGGKGADGLIQYRFLP